MFKDAQSTFGYVTLGRAAQILESLGVIGHITYRGPASSFIDCLHLICDWTLVTHPSLPSIFCQFPFLHHLHNITNLPKEPIPGNFSTTTPKKSIKGQYFASPTNLVRKNCDGDRHDGGRRGERHIRR